jgi:16S rRNA (cytosine967-C5)-methyltransferase
VTASARGVALDVLERVLDRGQPFDDTFLGHPALPGLEPRDRAFARLLVTTVLRRLGQLDVLIATFVRKPPAAARVMNLLRLGMAQLLFLQTPPHAAVGETVSLARGQEAFARGLVNAVLRRAAHEGPAQVAAQDSDRLNLPDWLFASWCRSFGEETTRAIAAMHREEPPLDLTVAGDPALLADEIGGRALAGTTLRRETAGPIEAITGYAEGRFWVQDVAAALPARLLREVAGRRVIDLCAAPGGKTAQLTAAGAVVSAVEISARRATRLRSNLGRLGLAAEIVVADALTWRPDRPAPLALLDAPCTATGTIRRHPDIAWHKTPADVVRMSALQRKLLAAAAEMLAPGGTLVYASCSLQAEEGPLLVSGALADGLPLRPDPIGSDELDGLPVEITHAGAVRTLPSHLAEQGGMDGFFIARFQKAG